MVKVLLCVFFGGGIGSVLRYGVQMLLHEKITAYDFPWSTLAVNIAGSFLIGLFYAFSDKFNLPVETRVFLTAGLCGGFTTFSTFSNDILELIRQGNVIVCVIYAFVSVAAGIIACFCGASFRY
ncbi:MAG: fluoride efflux transporter CrcB [Candidatus Amulumruptor caecigallinarius]|nr:fluoride efflux transporter CrcB [Candidatus Amulumruptor caecigallinarius]